MGGSDDLCSSSRKKKSKDETIFPLDAKRSLVGHIDNFYKFILLSDYIENIRQVEKSSMKEQILQMEIDNCLNNCEYLFAELNNIHSLLDYLKMNPQFTLSEVCQWWDRILLSKDITKQQLEKLFDEKLSYFFAKYADFTPLQQDLCVRNAPGLSTFNGEISIEKFCNIIICHPKLTKDVIQEFLIIENFKSMHWVKQISESFPEKFMNYIYPIFISEDIFLHKVLDPLVASSILLSMGAHYPEKIIHDIIQLVENVYSKNSYKVEVLLDTLIILLKKNPTLIEMFSKTLQKKIIHPSLKDFNYRIIQSANKLQFLIEGNKAITKEEEFIFLLQFNEIKKKFTTVKEITIEELKEEIEKKFSLEPLSYKIEMYDKDCEDYIEMDEVLTHLKRNKIHKLKIIEKKTVTPSILIQKAKQTNDINDVNAVKHFDNYKVISNLKSNNNNNNNIQTYLVEEMKINKESKTVVLKYIQFTGNKAEENLSNFIKLIYQAKNFIKGNSIEIYDIFKPEVIDSKKVNNLYHIAFTIPYYSSGSLFFLIKEKVHLPSKILFSIVKQILETFSYLELNSIEYGNIKLENILIESIDLIQGTIKTKLSDWWQLSGNPNEMSGICQFGIVIYRILSFDLNSENNQIVNYSTDELKDKVYKISKNKKSSTVSMLLDLILQFTKKESKMAAKTAYKLLQQYVQQAKEKQNKN
ncbi:hypothetical protein ABK040_008893 [Willaertia magna]